MVSDDSVGFEDGAAVPLVDFTYPDDAPAGNREAVIEAIEEIRRQVEATHTGVLLDWLATAGTAEAIGRRVLALAYVVQAEHAPRTQRELADRMGLSLGRVNAISANVGAAWREFREGGSERSPEQ
jgi:Trp operon repressor